jgi:hypothetical protein
LKTYALYPSEKFEKRQPILAGYEPVPGKAQHSQGKLPSKAKKSLNATERKFSHRARERQLDRWQEEHPASPRKAAQHLHPPNSAARRKPSAAGTKAAAKKAVSK